jgi:hypothetical protein
VVHRDIRPWAPDSAKAFDIDLHTTTFEEAAAAGSSDPPPAKST